MKSVIYDWLKSDIRYLRIKKPCGTGKSYYVIHSVIAPMIYIARKTGKAMRFVIAVPDHSIVIGKDNIEGWLDDLGIEYTHFYGKKTDSHVLCLNPDKAYHPGCKGCSDYAVCPYQKQNRESEVTIIAMENMDQFGSIAEESEVPTILYMDESPERVFMSEKIIPNTSKINHSKSVYTVHEDGNIYNFLTGVDLKPSFKVNNEEDFFLLQFFKQNFNITGHILKGEINLFGQKKKLIHDGYSKVIMSCATTPLRFMHSMFRTKKKDWVVIETDAKLKNSVIRLNGGFSKAWSVSNLKELEGFIKTMESFAPKILIVTKKAIEEQMIKDGFDWCEYVHYYGGRGSNKWNKEYDLVIVYSRFGLRPQEHLKYNMMGVEKSILEELETAEVEQCVHRCRPLNRPNIPIMLMSNRKFFEDQEYVNVPKTILEDFTALPLITLTPDYKEIMDELDIDRNRAYAYMTFLEYFRLFILKIAPLKEQIYEYTKKHTVQEAMDFFDKSRATIKRYKFKSTKERREDKNDRK